MEQKHRFVSLAVTGRFTFTELCADFHVSRKSGHKWLVRYRKEGMAGLRERSRRPHGCAHQTAARIEQLILRERRKHRTWCQWPLQNRPVVATSKPATLRVDWS